MPGVGAFPVKPTVDGQPNGIESIGELLEQVVQHFGESLAPRERLRNAAWVACGSRFDLPGEGLILVPDAECCFPLPSEKGDGCFALRLSGRAGESILDVEAWKISGSILIDGEDTSSLLLVPISSVEQGPTALGFSEPPGLHDSKRLCVILRLDLEAAVRLAPKNLSSLLDLRRFTANYLGCCATPAVVKTFMVRL